MKRLLLASTLLLTGCGGALDPKGPGAERIADLWWVMFWVGLIPLVVVCVLLVMVVTGRGPQRFLTEGRLIVYGGVAFSAVLLVPVVVMTIVTERAMDAGPDGELVIDVTGHQFWWDITYPAPDGEGTVRTANELHIPAGQPVELLVTSVDVIHSIWVPEIQGKIDMIPGTVNQLTVEAAEPGVYKGRCAEFCGIGHGVMRLLVVAHTPEDFDTWLEAEAAPARVTEVDAGTRQVFGNSCAPCHTVQGLFEDQTFEGDFGPDLTHFASRRMIGANLLPNTSEALARWITDPQGVKPGNRMPDVGLDPEELNQVIDLLNGLD